MSSIRQVLPAAAAGGGGAARARFTAGPSPPPFAVPPVAAPPVLYLDMARSMPSLSTPRTTSPASTTATCAAGRGCRESQDSAWDARSHPTRLHVLHLALVERREDVVHHGALPLRPPDADAQPRKVLRPAQAGDDAAHAVVAAVAALLAQPQRGDVNVQVVVDDEQPRRRHLVELEQRHHGLAAGVHERLRLHEQHLWRARGCERLRAEHGAPGGGVRHTPACRR